MAAIFPFSGRKKSRRDTHRQVAQARKGARGYRIVSCQIEMVSVVPLLLLFFFFTDPVNWNEDFRFFGRIGRETIFVKKLEINNEWSGFSLVMQCLDENSGISWCFYLCFGGNWKKRDRWWYGLFANFREAS